MQEPHAAIPFPLTGSPLARLLVGYDGSAGADAAAAFGLWLAGTVGSTTTLVHACPALERSLPPDVPRAAATQQAADEADWKRRLERLGDRAAQDARIDCRVDRGSPAGVLLAAAAQTDADLVLVGSHGVGRLREALLGSVSAQVLSHAPCSVMVFRESAWSAPAAAARAVVAGIDGSHSSGHVLALAQALAVALGATLVLLHAYDPHVPFVSEPTKAMRDALRRQGRAVVHDARATVAAPLDVVVEEVVEGYARDELTAACERQAPALLVAGSRGLGGFGELMLGSTARWVANCAPCPVLVARTPPR